MDLIFSRDQDGYDSCKENSKTYWGFAVPHYIQHSGLFHSLTNKIKWPSHLKLAVQNQDQILILFVG